MDGVQKRASDTGTRLRAATPQAGTWVRTRAGIVLLGVSANAGGPEAQLRVARHAELGDAELGTVTASRVGCERYPRTYPIFRAIGTNDPRGVINRAEARAVQMLTGVIDELSRIQHAVQGGAAPTPPLISPTLADAMRTRLRLNATNRRVWTDRGPGTAELIIRWYTNVRKIATAVRYVCLGAHCHPTQEWAYTQPRTASRDPRERVRTIYLCRRFWGDTPDNQALTVLHELAHLYYDLAPPHGDVDIGGGPGNAVCLEQFVAEFHGVPIVPEFTAACRPPTP